MDVQPELASGEVKHLQRCINDLVSLLALPAIWSGGDPSQVLHTLLDALMRMLRLDLIYARLNDPAGEGPIEMARVAQSRQHLLQPQQVGEVLKRWLGGDPQQWPALAAKRIDDEDISIVLMRLGPHGEMGVIAAGSHRADFPGQTEKLLLGVAANQASIGLQEARFRTQQKRVADELDQRVAQRTAELSTANAELQLQVGLLQHLPVSAWTLKPDGTPDFVNRVWLEYSGQTLDFVRSHPEAWMTAVHPEDRDTASRAFWEGVRSGQGFAFEIRSLRARDGTYRWHLQQAVVLRDAEGKVLKFVGTTTDIDEQKRAQEKLRASESDLRQALDSIPGWVATFNPAGQADFFNRRILEYFGNTPEEMNAWATNDVVHPDDLPRIMAEFTHSFTTGTPFDNELRYRRADGVYRWFQARILPSRDTEGRIARWYALVTDIDDQKRADEELRASESKLKKIINTVPTPAWSAHPDGYCDFINQPWLDYAGLSAEQGLGWGWGAAIHPDDLPGLVEYWRTCLASGTPVDTEARMRRFDGVYRWFLFRASPLRDEAGNIIKWYGTNTDIEDRKRAEEKLQASETNLREILDGIPGLVTAISPAGVPEVMNRPFLEYFGKTAEEMKAWETADVIHPDDLPRVAATFPISIATGTPYDGELRYRRADGVYRWFQLGIHPARDADGRITGWYGLITDIDDRKRAEEKLRLEEKELKHSEARKTAILESALDCIVTIDHEGCITEFNPPAEHTFGYRRDEVLGKHLADTIIPPSLREKHRQGFARYLATGESRVLGKRIEMTAVRADGSEFPVELAITRIPLEGPPSFTGYLRDITERKRAEQELRRSEAFLAEAQHLSRIGSFSWLVATDEITWSEQLYRIFQIDRDAQVTFELIGTRIHPEDLSVFQEQIERSRRDRSDMQFEFRLQLPDGAVKHVHVAAHIRGDHGQLEYIGAVQDVTERRSSEEALSKARSALSQVAKVTSLGVLTASIAHEVNQPLSGIVTNASTCLRMLAADPPNVDGARETARRTIRDGNRASEVITRLRALYGKKDPTIESVDLNEATREVLALSVRELQRNRVIVLQELADDLPLVTADRVQLQQVILNLLRNASDAMSAVDDRPRDLLIRTEPDDNDRVRLSVSDVGIGFEPQAADKLFEAFYTTKNEGMGIGLSVSRSIIERHRGRLWAKLNNGPGVTFSFSIPCKPEGLTSDGTRASRIPSVSDAA
jgi:PAS domain S-box-containing protein